MARSWSTPACWLLLRTKRSWPLCLATKSHTRLKSTLISSKSTTEKLIALKVGAIITSVAANQSIGDLANLVEAAVRNGYSRSLENQADRIGTEYMVAARYDPREAARVWKVMAQKFGDQPTNFFWSRHDNSVTRRSYLMAELKNNYSDLDFQSYSRGGEEYSKIAGMMLSEQQDKRKVKVRLPCGAAETHEKRAVLEPQHHSTESTDPQAQQSAPQSPVPPSPSLFLLPRQSLTPGHALLPARHALTSRRDLPR